MHVTSVESLTARATACSERHVPTSLPRAGPPARAPRVDAPPRPQEALRKLREGLWERVRGLEQSDPVLRRQPPAHAAAERPADKPWETREDFNACVTPRLLRLAERYARGGSVRWGVGRKGAVGWPRGVDTRAVSLHALAQGVRSRRGVWQVPG